MKLLITFAILMLSFSTYADSAELEKLYAEDQADLRADPKKEKYDEYIKAQVKRIARANEILSSGKEFSANAYYSAAMLFQHGEVHKVENFKRAYELAKKAAALDPGHARAAWLTCSAEDRYRVNTNLPQIWGTQLIRQMDKERNYKVMVFEAFDKTAKTDEERVKCGLPTLKEMERRIAVMADIPNVIDQYRYWRTGTQ